MQLNRRKLYLAFAIPFAAAQPVTEDEDEQAPKCGKSQVKGSDRIPHPAAPDTDQMTGYKPEQAESKV